MHHPLDARTKEPSPLKKTKGGEPAAAVLVPRERILHAAARLFHECGYQRTTVRDIGSAVGILSGSLFYHFRSKDEILAEIMRETALSLCLRAEDVLNRTEEPLQRLQMLIDLELEWIVGEIKKDHLAVLVFEWREVPQSAKAELTRLRGQYQCIWMTVLEQYGDVAPMRIPADAAARILHGALMGAMNWFRTSGRYSALEFRDMLIKLIQS